MLYCTYEQYQAVGGTLDEDSFAPLCRQASRLIDQLTFGRAEPHVRGCAACGDSLAEACGQIIRALEAAQQSGAVPGAVSVNNDGYAVTFASGTPAGRLTAEAYGILLCCLGADPHNLLYRGCF